MRVAIVKWNITALESHVDVPKSGAKKSFNSPAHVVIYYTIKVEPPVWYDVYKIERGSGPPRIDCGIKITDDHGSNLL